MAGAMQSSSLARAGIIASMGIPIVSMGIRYSSIIQAKLSPGQGKEERVSGALITGSDTA